MIKNNVIEKEDLPKDLIALIDGDEYIYKVGYATQHWWYNIFNEQKEFIAKFPYMKQAVAHCKENPTHYYEKELIVGTEEDALENLKLSIKTLLDDCKTDQCRIFLNGEINFRNELATIQPYKENRDDSKRPVHYGLIRQTLIEEYFAEVVEGYESDDAMAIAQYQNMLKQQEWDDLHAPKNL